MAFVSLKLSPKDYSQLVSIQGWGFFPTYLYNITKKLSDHTWNTTTWIESVSGCNGWLEIVASTAFYSSGEN